MNWYVEVLKKYAIFTGRAQRKEYWMFVLFNFLFSIGLVIIDGLLGTHGVLRLLYALGVIVPGIAVGIRRLHNTNRTGWWIFIGLVPLVGAIVLLVFTVQDSDPGENQYGENPKLVTV